MTRRINGWTALLVGAVIACGGGDSGTAIPDSVPSGEVDIVMDGTGENEAPTVTIQSPTDGDVFLHGDAIEIVVKVNDDRDARDSLALSWTSNLDGILSDNGANAAGSASIETSSLSPGNHTITIEATDLNGATGSASITFLVNQLPAAPEVAISPPEPTTTDDLNAQIITAATDANVGGDNGRDPNQITYDYRWFKNGSDANIGTDTVPASLTTKGEVWQLRVTANDGHGNGPEGTADVTIQNTPPTCESAVILPTTGGTETDFVCQCTQWSDPDAGDEPLDQCTFKTTEGVILGGETGAVGPCTLEAMHTEKGMTIICTLFPNDGEDSGDGVESDPATVLNTAPTPPSGVVLTPEEADVTTVLTCSYEQTATDADDDPVNYTSHWVVNGYENPGGNTSMILAGQLMSAVGVSAVKGDTVLCRVRATDTQDESSPVDSNAVVLGNVPPEGGNVLLGPMGAKEGDTLTCTAQGATDKDNDTITWTYQWTVNGEVVADQTDQTLSSAYFDKGDVVLCIATPTDGEANGPPVNSKVSIQIQNTLPVLLKASVTPNETNKLGTFTCSYDGWSDADPADAEAVTYAWILVAADGAETPIEGESDAALQPTTLSPGTTLLCRVTPTNGDEAGAPVDSNLVTVVNTKPTLQSVTLMPTEAYADSTLTCTPEGFADADGDNPNYTYAWKKKTEFIPGQDEPTLSGVFVKDDEIFCVVTPNDGYVDGAAVLSNKIIIGNKLPAINGVTLSPSYGAACETYTCSTDSVVDPDVNDNLLLSYRWEKNGTPLDEETDTLAGADLAPGDQLQCFVSASDGALDENFDPISGPEAESNTANVYNTKPTIETVTIESTSLTPGSLLTCQPLGFTDQECNPEPGYIFKWYKGATVIQDAGEQVFDTSGIASGTKISCQAIPFDGYEYGPPKLSEAVTLENQAPTPPVVAISAPNGADGDITCTIVEAAQDNEPLTTTWYWQIGDKPETVGAQSLPSIGVKHCDLIRCRAVVSDNLLEASSNTAEKILPFGNDCDDNNECTDNACAPTGGCQVVNNTAGCDDNNACTTQDTCAGGTCVGGPALACDNGLFCDGAETCEPTTGCVDGTPPNPDDGVECTVDTCDEFQDTIVHTPNHSVCNNQQYCDGVETCDAVNGCVDGVAPDTNDNVGCTIDTCDEGTDTIVHTPNDTACDNSLYIESA